MHDVLSEVLDTLELESSLYFRAELSAPFSIAVPENRRVIRFHIATSGPCVIRVADGPAITFGPGDLVLLPHGLEHTLSDSAASETHSLTEVVDSSGFDGEGPLVYGGGGEKTTLVCGHLAFSTDVTHPFIETLPMLLHLRRQEGPDYSWIERMLAFTEHESRTKPRGWQGVVERLSQILFLYVLRAHLDESPDSVGAVAALADTRLSAALQSIHSAPATDWSLDTLAQKAGMSRSAFVRRFASAVGMAPMKYLTQWRLSRARHLLVHTDASAGEIGALVGYASEAAFNRAFRDRFEAPPVAFRRRTRAMTEGFDAPLR